MLPCGFDTDAEEYVRVLVDREQLRFATREPRMPRKPSFDLGGFLGWDDILLEAVDWGNR